MGQRIRAEHSGMSTSVWISLRQDGTGVRIRQMLTHQSSPGECASVGRCLSGLVSTLNVLGCRAIRTRIGYVQTTLSLERNEQEFEKESEGASKVARDRARIMQEERARDMRIEGTGASSSRDGSGMSRHHAQLNRVSVLTSLRENRAMMRT